VFFENVKNLVSHDNGNTIKVITKTLSQFGYDFHLKVLNTKEHGNIPQNRERIFIIGFKKDENDYSKYFRFPQPIKLNKSVTDLLETDVDEKYFYPKSWYGYDMLEEMMKSKKTIYQWRRHYVRENKNNVCPTLTANMGTGGHNVPLVLTDAGIRKLTPRECFRFQGFPDSYILPETVKNASLYKQAGNSVSVSVIERIGNNIQKALNKEFCDDENPDLFTG
jgi:DNA (cytosine-5)-methyltransferase 1